MPSHSATRPWPLLALVLLACNDPASTPEVATATVGDVTAVGVPGWELADTPSVTFLRTDGSAAAGIWVEWAVLEGGGSVRILDSVTDAAGMARAIWTLGSRPGMNRLRAASAGGIGQEFAVLAEVFRADRVTSNGVTGCGLVGGTLWCWGEGFGGTEAPVSVHPAGLDNRAPVRVDSSHWFTEIGITQAFYNGFYREAVVCGVDTQHVVWCTASPGESMSQVGGLPAVRGLVSDRNFDFAAQRGRFCALAVADSMTWCWHGDSLPSTVDSAPAFRAIWLSFANTSGLYPPYNAQLGCGLTVDSTAACWGMLYGESLTSSYAVPVAPGHRFTQLATGDRFACGLKANGEVWCWGGSTAVAGPDPGLVEENALLLGTGYWLEAAYLRDRRFAGHGGTYPEQAWSEPDSRTPFAGVTGLEGLPVSELGSNADLGCLLLAGGEVYCSDFNTHLSILDPALYYPVPPVRR